MKDFDYENPTSKWDFNQITRKVSTSRPLKDAEFAEVAGDKRKNSQGCRRKQRKNVPFERRTNPERRKPRVSFKV